MRTKSTHQSPSPTSVEYAEYIGFAKNEQLLTIDGDLGAAVLSVEHLVADLDVHRDALVLLEAARADGDDLALLRLFFRGIGDIEPAAHLLRVVECPDDDAIGEGSHFHGRRLLGRHAECLAEGEHSGQDTLRIDHVVKT